MGKLEGDILGVVLGLEDGLEELGWYEGEKDGSPEVDGSVVGEMETEGTVDGVLL